MSEREIIEQKIRDLQADLTASDYKIIKCSEANLLGQECPYDVSEVHAERQTIRDEINKLQEELKEVDAAAEA